MYDTFKERNIEIYKTTAWINKEIDNQKSLRFELQEDGRKDLYGQFKSYPFIIQCKNHKNLIHAGEITKLEGTLTREKDGTIRIIIAPKFTSRAVIKSNNSKFMILCTTDSNEVVELLKDKINNEIEIQQRLIMKTRDKSLLKEIDFKGKSAKYTQTIYEDEKYIQKRRLRI